MMYPIKLHNFCSSCGFNLWRTFSQFFIFQQMLLILQMFVKMNLHIKCFNIFKHTHTNVDFIHSLSFNLIITITEFIYLNVIMAVRCYIY